MAEVIVVTGPPGAGKTTVARLLSAMFDPSALVAGDDFFAFIDQGYVAPWTGESHHQNEVVVDAAATATGRFAAGGYTVVYDGVVGPWFIDAFTRATGLAVVHYVMLLPPAEVCEERVASRVGHGFTDLEATRHMYREFAGATIDARHVVVSTAGPESIAADICGLVQAGTTLWSNEGRPGVPG